MDFITEPARTLPVTDACDVLVCGGGVAGIAAALAAARTGAKTMLLEREYMLGGLATLGLVTIYLPLDDGCGHQVSFGIAEELLRQSIRTGIVEDRYPAAWMHDATAEARAAAPRYEVQYNPNVFAMEAEKLLTEAGVCIRYGTLAAETVVENAKITAVIVENKSGRGAIRAKSVVDATGDADICKLAGADCAVSRAGNTLAAWYYRYTQQKGTQLKMLGFAEVPDDLLAHGPAAENLSADRFSGLDGAEISTMVIHAHQAAMSDLLDARQQDPTALPTVFPTIPQLRMTRRLVGCAAPDLDSDHRHVPTSIGMVGNWRRRGPAYELPLACLYGTRVRNLITAGRNISCTESMWDILRVIPVCAVTGQAAGTAAAMSDDFATLDVSALQAQLRRDGVKLHFDELDP